jgi:uncharacterized OB-fold protein
VLSEAGERPDFGPRADVGTPSLKEQEVQMFECGRCGDRFSPIRVPAGADCPRCRAREGVSVPLTLTLFAAPRKAVPEKQIPREGDAKQ